MINVLFGPFLILFLQDEMNFGLLLLEIVFTIVLCHSQNICTGSLNILLRAERENLRIIHNLTAEPNSFVSNKYNMIMQSNLRYNDLIITISSPNIC